MSDYFEVIMNDPDFVFADSESAFFHFNAALTDGPRSPVESVTQSEEVSKRNNISISAAALLVGQEIQQATSPETGEWRLEEVCL